MWPGWKHFSTPPPQTAIWRSEPYRLDSRSQECLRGHRIAHQASLLDKGTSGRALNIRDRAKNSHSIHPHVRPGQEFSPISPYPDNGQVQPNPKSIKKSATRSTDEYTKWTRKHRARNRSTPPLVGRPGASGESSLSRETRYHHSITIARVSGTSGESGFHLESLREGVDAKPEFMIKPPLKKGLSQTRESQEFPDRQRFKSYLKTGN